MEIGKKKYIFDDHSPHLTTSFIKLAPHLYSGAFYRIKSRQGRLLISFSLGIACST